MPASGRHSADHPAKHADHRVTATTNRKIHVCGESDGIIVIFSAGQHPWGATNASSTTATHSRKTADLARQLTISAHLIVNVLDRLGVDDWDRTIMYSYPRRTERSLRLVTVVHTVHEVRHHVLDIHRQLP